jgi:hypothetical protein
MQKFLLELSFVMALKFVALLVPAQPYHRTTQNERRQGMRPENNASDSKPRSSFAVEMAGATLHQLHWLSRQLQFSSRFI